MNNFTVYFHFNGLFTSKISKTMRTTRSKKTGAKRELDACSDGSQEELSQNKKQKITPLPTVNPKKLCLFSAKFQTELSSKFAENNTTIASIITLPHPRSKQATPFALTADTKKLCEIKNFSRPYKTILTPNRIISNPTIYIITPFDPTFILLSLLATNQPENFCLLEQLLIDSEFKDLHLLAPNFTENLLEKTCDVRKHENQIACKYNKEKTMLTLESKVRKVAEKLPNLNSFQLSYKSIVSTEDGALKYAISLVTEYLSDTLAGDLAEHLGLTDYSKLVAECEREIRKVDVSSVGDEVDTKKGVKKGSAKKQSRAKRILEKTDKSGMKSLSSFFTKPKD